MAGIPIVPATVAAAAMDMKLFFTLEKWSHFWASGVILLCRVACLAAVMSLYEGTGILELAIGACYFLS